MANPRYPAKLWTTIRKHTMERSAPAENEIHNQDATLGKPAGWSPESEVDHYCVCPGCGALIDMRDLGMAIDHAGELPHGRRILPS